MRHHIGILSRIADKPARVLEVGCYRGELSAALLKHRPQLHLTMVDPWAAPSPESRYLKSGDRAARELATKSESIYKDAIANTAFAVERRTIVREYSQAAAKLLENQLFDLVFIDADHTYESVCADLQAWYPRVRPNGWFSGHDYRQKPPQFGVKSAVDEFAASRGLSIETDRGTTWFLKIPG